MTKKITISTDDQAAFKEAMRGVKRLSHTKITTPAPAPQKKRKIEPNEIEDNTNIYFSDYEKFEAVDSSAKLEFYRPGIQHKIIRNLRKGQYNAESVLDLHGKTVEEARQSLICFLSSCQRNGIRHVIIIHGKGRSLSKPTIKNKLNHWLRQTEQILAFCSAAPKDGGTGALYVLLRRQE